jgi:hypothetical protein
MPHEPDRLTPARDPLAARLARLAPSPGGLDRDALLFHAGRSTARPSRLWPLAVVALAGFNVVALAFLWANRPEQLVRMADARTAAPADDEPAAESAPPARQARDGDHDRRYSTWRRKVLERGEDWPDSAAMAERAASMNNHPLSAFGAQYGLRPGGRGMMDSEMMAPAMGGR